MRFFWVHLEQDGSPEREQGVCRWAGKLIILHGSNDADVRVRVCYTLNEDNAFMKLYPDKLAAHLQRQLAPVYLLHGEEPLQIMEYGDAIRRHARDNGFDERTVIQPADDSDWASFQEAADSLSLFAERRIIELRIPSGKPGKAGAGVLRQYCSSPAEDILLLITAGKLDRGGSSSAWFKAIDKVGVTMALYPIAVSKLASWISRRLATHGLQADTDALTLIVERVEGNLLAAQQEIERLALLYPSGLLTRDNVLEAVADSARFSITDLSQAALTGQQKRALRILSGLRDEAVPEVLILWSLTQEVRAASRTSEAHAVGTALDAALKSAGVWQNRVPALKQAISRHDVSSWLSMLLQCTTIDRQIKGQAPGSPWDALEALIVQLSGSRPLFKQAHSTLIV